MRLSTYSAEFRCLIHSQAACLFSDHVETIWPKPPINGRWALSGVSPWGTRSVPITSGNWLNSGLFSTAVPHWIGAYTAEPLASAVLHSSSVAFSVTGWRYFISSTRVSSALNPLSLLKVGCQPPSACLSNQSPP